MKRTSWLVATIAAAVVTLLVATTMYGFDWPWVKKQESKSAPVIQKKEIQVQPVIKIPTRAEAGFQPLREPLPTPDSLTACAEAYGRIRSAMDRVTVEPLCTFRRISGETGVMTYKCYVSTGDATNPAYPIEESIFGGSSASSWDLCWELPRIAGWPPSCFKADDTYTTLHPVAASAVADLVVEYTFDELTDPSSSINQDSSRFNGPFASLPRVPLFTLVARSAGDLGATPTAQLIAFRALAGSLCIGQIRQTVWNEHRDVICVNADMLSFQDGCR